MIKSNVKERSLINQFWVIPFLFAMAMWMVFWVDERYMLDLYRYGLLPKHVDGLIGIFTSPFIHGSLAHLTSNTLPIILLGSGIGYFYPKVFSRVFLIGWLVSGLLVWFFGRETYHIGASGLVYALAFFIFFSGLFRGHPQLIALSLLIAFLYGGLVWGMLPIEEHISWESHLYGGIVGLVTAFFLRHSNPKHLSNHFWKRDKGTWDPHEEARLEQMDYWKTPEQIAEENSNSDDTITYNYTYIPKSNNKEK